MAGVVKFAMDELVAIVDKMRDRADTVPRAPLALIIADAIEEEIETEGHGDWAEFSPATIAMHPMTKKGKKISRSRAGGKLLQSTGKLANIQTKSSHKWVKAFSPAKKYAHYHVTGTRRFGRQYMPARDFLAVDLDAVIERIGVVFLEEMTR